MIHLKQLRVWQQKLLVVGGMKRTRLMLKACDICFFHWSDLSWFHSDIFQTDILVYRSAIYPQGRTFKYGLGGRLEKDQLSHFNTGENFLTFEFFVYFPACQASWLCCTNINIANKYILRILALKSPLCVEDNNSTREVSWVRILTSAEDFFIAEFTEQTSTSIL